jgi:hypothetical protein
MHEPATDNPGESRPRPARRRTGWVGHIAANVAIGFAAGAAWPFVYIMGYVIAGAAGWMVGDPTLTDDGLAIPIGLGIFVVVVISAAFLSLNISIARWARIPPFQWIASAVVVSLLMAAASDHLLYPR